MLLAIMQALFRCSPGERFVQLDYTADRNDAKMSNVFDARQKARREGTLGRATESPREPSEESELGELRRRAKSFRDAFISTSALGTVDEHLVSLVAPTSYAGENFRRLRHLIEQRRNTGVSSVAVTSPTSGDGKSLVAINLAGALAQNPEARVLLIDADLRKPTVALRLGLNETQLYGLERLKSAQTLSDLVIKLERYNLSLLAPRRAVSSPYDLLKSETFQKLLDEARGSYDFVIMDTSPVLIVPDCRLFEEYIDGYLLVIRAHGTPREMIEETLVELPREKILGIVFNRFDRKRDYYGNYYRQR